MSNSQTSNQPVKNLLEQDQTSEKTSQIYQFPKTDLASNSHPDLEIGLAIVNLREGDFIQRANTTRLLGDLAFLKKKRFPEAVETLCLLLKNDPNQNVREEVAWALWKIGDLRAKDVLIQALRKDESTNVKEKSARALGLMGVKEAAPYMISMLGMGRQVPAKLRAGLAAALGMLEHEKAYAVLLKTAKDPEPIVRDEAVKALGKLLNDSSARISKPALKIIAKSVNHRQEKIQLVRQSALKALRLFHHPAAIQMIAKVAIKDPDSSTRLIATETLMCFEGPEVESTLLKALEDSNWEVRKTAGRILAEFVKRSQIHNMPKVREAILRMERMFASGSREWRLASQAFMNL
ncbi:MAG: HEAT repeat domain-containing protein [Pseudomonadota bacterium]